MNHEILEADLTWTTEGFFGGLQVEVRGDRIVQVGKDLASTASIRRLKGRALLPGFVNVHSHAFQRGLRGSGETFPAGAGSFWTWREAMYALVESLDEERFSRLCRQAFREMLRAGITTVGEFHYLHHLGEERSFAADRLVLEAAKAEGIRIVLLQTFYKTGGVGQPLQGGQKRFATPSLAEYWQQFDHLQSLLEPTTQSLGVVGHSIRAVPLDDLAGLFEGARQRSLPLHMHVEEQKQEIQACLEAYGKTPMAVVLELGPDRRFTAIHCTHTRPDELEAFLATGAHVGLCPLSEANLGDGHADLPRMLHGLPDQIAIGTDSNNRLSMFEELRILELGQRTLREKRGVCLDQEGRCARPLIRMATEAGARALAVAAGRIEAGLLADFVAIDLEHPHLRGSPVETLEDALVFGCSNEVFAEVCVGGRWL